MGVAVQLGAIQETLLIPLYGRALDARASHSVLSDVKDAELVAAIDYDFAKFRGPSLAGSVLRASIFDEYVRSFLAAHPDGTVVDARADNTLFDAKIDVHRFAAAEHINSSRRGKTHGPIDTALAELGLRRRVRIVVPNHTSALLLAGPTDLVALTTAHWQQTIDGLTMRTFAIPLDLPHLDIGIAWHPRTEHDAAHRWFRRQVATTFESIIASAD
ncbi:LysR substrate-binding domain-containing protein [Mycolicibacterium sp. CBM1]